MIQYLYINYKIYIVNNRKIVNLLWNYIHIVGVTIITSKQKIW